MPAFTARPRRSWLARLTERNGLVRSIDRIEPLVVVLAMMLVAPSCTPIPSRHVEGQRPLPSMGRRPGRSGKCTTITVPATPSALGGGCGLCRHDARFGRHLPGR